VHGAAIVGDRDVLLCDPGTSAPEVISIRHWEFWGTATRVSRPFGDRASGGVRGDDIVWFASRRREMRRVNLHSVEPSRTILSVSTALDPNWNGPGGDGSGLPILSWRSALLWMRMAA